MRLTFKSADWGKHNILHNVGGPCQISWRPLLEKDWSPLKKREFCQQMAFRLELQYWLFSGSPACSPALQVSDSPVSTTAEDNFLKSISLSLIYTYVNIHTYINTYTHTWPLIITGLNCVSPLTGSFLGFSPNSYYYSTTQSTVGWIYADKNCRYGGTADMEGWL